MNKGLMMAAFAVLLFGMAFADMAGAGVSPGVQGKYNASGVAGDITTEGGNVTDVNLTANTSTEKWAGFYGNVSGNLYLQKNTDVNALYNWTWTPTGKGTVCVSTASAYTWGALIPADPAKIDDAWSFAHTDADSANNTLTTNCSLYINPQGELAGKGVLTYNSTGAPTWETCAVNNGTNLTNKSEYAFCVNMSITSTVAAGGLYHYQVIAPTNATAGSTERYYFYVELL